MLLSHSGPVEWQCHPMVRRLQVQVQPTPLLVKFSLVVAAVYFSAFVLQFDWVSSSLDNLFFIIFIIFLFPHLFSLVNIFKRLFLIANYEKIRWTVIFKIRVKWQKCCLFSLCWGNMRFILMWASSSLYMSVRMGVTVTLANHWRNVCTLYTAANMMACMYPCVQTHRPALGVWRTVHTSHERRHKRGRVYTFAQRLRAKVANPNLQFFRNKAWK